MQRSRSTRWTMLRRRATRARRTVRPGELHAIRSALRTTARQKVWYLFIDETFPIDAHEPEPEELRELQAAYRRRLQSDTHVFHPLTSSEALEASVLKLRGDLTRLRRGVKQWAFAVIALLLFLVAATVWLVQGQRRQTGVIQKQGEQVNVIVDRYQKMQQALVRLADVEAQSKQPGAKVDS